MPANGVLDSYLTNGLETQVIETGRVGDRHSSLKVGS